MLYTKRLKSGYRSQSSHSPTGYNSKKASITNSFLSVSFNNEMDKQEGGFISVEENRIRLMGSMVSFKQSNVFKPPNKLDKTFNEEVFNGCKGGFRQHSSCLKNKGQYNIHQMYNDFEFQNENFENTRKETKTAVKENEEARNSKEEMLCLGRKEEIRKISRFYFFVSFFEIKRSFKFKSKEKYGVLKNNPLKRNTLNRRTANSKTGLEDMRKLKNLLLCQKKASNVSTVIKPRENQLKEKHALCVNHEEQPFLSKDNSNTVYRNSKTIQQVYLYVYLPKPTFSQQVNEDLFIGPRINQSIINNLEKHNEELRSYAKDKLEESRIFLSLLTNKERLKSIFGGFEFFDLEREVKKENRC